MLTPCGVSSETSHRPGAHGGRDKAHKATLTERRADAHNGKRGGKAYSVAFPPLLTPVDPVGGNAPVGKEVEPGLQSPRGFAPYSARTAETMQPPLYHPGEIRAYTNSPKKSRCFV